MEKLNFQYEGGEQSFEGRSAVLVGVVGSGNLEVLFEPKPLQGRCLVEITTAAGGFQQIWSAVMNDFFERHRLRDVRVSINDVGATPAVVGLRLDQGVEELQRSDP